MGGQTCALPISGNIDFRQSPTEEFDAAGGEGEPHVHVANALQQGEVDRLLGVHVLVVVRDLHDVDELEGKLDVVEAEEMRAVELRDFDTFDEALDKFCNLFDILDRKSTSMNSSY